MEEKITETVKSSSNAIIFKKVSGNKEVNDISSESITVKNELINNDGTAKIKANAPKNDEGETETNAEKVESDTTAETNLNDTTDQLIGESDDTVSDKSEIQNNGGAQSKNYKHVILEDWGLDEIQSSAVETPAENVNNDNSNVNNNNDNNNDNSYNNNNNNNVSNANECNGNNNNNNTNHENNNAKGEVLENNKGEHSKVSNSEEKSVEETNGLIEEKLEELDRTPNSVGKELLKPVLDKKRSPLKYSSFIVSSQDIVEILDNSVERVCRPIIPAKDIFLSIELTKQLNQKLSQASAKKNEEAKNNETNKLVVPDSHSKMIKTITQVENLTPIAKKEDINKSVGSEKKDEDPSKKGKKKTSKKNINIGDEMERTIALRQLRDEFPITRRRSHTTKKVNHIPFLAASVLEKALTTVSSPSKVVGQRRRPCYLPDNASPVGDESNKRGTEDGQKDPNLSDISNSSTPVVRTYCIKRKSTDSESEVKTALHTFLSATKELQENEENTDSKPKKQKTVQENEKSKVTTPKKGKDINKKRNLELEKLLGDEGAVRMLYETQHQDGNNKKKSRIKSTSGLKKDLMLKTKLVKNAVLRLSGATSDGVSLRGKRKYFKNDSEPQTDESVFVPSTPNIILYKPKKKQRAEASRILYRHSSSDSFESLDGLRRSSIEGQGLNSTNNDESAAANSELFKDKSNVEEEADSGTSKKSKIPKKTKTVSGERQKKLKTRKERQMQSKIVKERSNRENTDNSKIILSNIPVRKSNRPRVVSKKYSIWASTSMDSLSIESLGLKKPKKPSQELAKKFNYKELRILQHGSLVQVILTPSSTVLKNSFNEQVLTELKEAFDFLAQQDSCSVILLTSHGTTFCQGIDLNYVLSVEEDDRKQTFGNLVNCLKQFILCLADCKKPVIAGVHAGAIGLGVTLLPYCDIVVCSDTASFYTPYSKLGQMSEGAATVTFPRIHKNLVADLLFRSEKLTAVEALKLGLVNEVIPEERFDDELMNLSRRIASQSQQAMNSMKSLINNNDFDKIAETLEIESQLILEHWCSNDCINNIIKFLNSGEVQFRQLDVT